MTTNYFLSLWICLFWTFLIKRIITWYLLSGTSLPSSIFFKIILVDMKVVSHCGFGVHFPNDAEHLFQWLLAICISSMGKGLFKSFACFFISWDVLLLSCKNCLHRKIYSIFIYQKLIYKLMYHTGLSLINDVCVSITPKYCDLCYSQFICHQARY